jgi:hypothetical protein
MICTAHQISFGLSDREECDGRVCGTYEAEERCIQGFGGKT